MAPSAPSGSATAAQNTRKPLGFMPTAKKHKHSFIQWFAMTGILLSSMRSLGQKYRLHDLEDETLPLKEEQQITTDRMNDIKKNLLNEASLETSGHFTARLRRLFGEDN